MPDPFPVDASLSFVRLSEVREGPVNWLWPNRLALGAVAHRPRQLERHWVAQPLPVR
jgi:hypothetical protein